MLFTFQSAANATTNGTALGTDGKDIYVKKLIVGKPVSAASIYLYNKSVAFSGDTSDIAFKATMGATISYQFTDSVSNQVVYDFTGEGNPGLQLDGGLLMQDQACQVTVIWEYVDQSN